MINTVRFRFSRNMGHFYENIVHHRPWGGSCRNGHRQYPNHSPVEVATGVNVYRMETGKW